MNISNEMGRRNALFCVTLVLSGVDPDISEFA